MATELRQGGDRVSTELKCRLCGVARPEREYRWVASRRHDVCRTCETLADDGDQVCAGCGTVLPLTSEHFELGLPGLRRRVCRRCLAAERDSHVRRSQRVSVRGGQCARCEGLGHRRPIGGKCPRCGEPYRPLPPLPRPHELDQPSRWVR